MTSPLNQGALGSPQDWLAHAGSLTPYAVEARYPGHLEDASPADVNQAIRLAGAVLR